LKKLDFENLEKLTACEIGFDEEIDLALHAVNDPEVKPQHSSSSNGSPKNQRQQTVLR